MSGLIAVTVPKWGLAMEEGLVTAWHVAEGDQVMAGQDLVDIETAKIANTVEAPASGRLRRIVAAPETTLPVGALLGVLAPGEASEAAVDAFIDRFATEAAERPAETPVEPELVETAVGRMRVLRTGGVDGPSVVLLHGFLGDLDSWMFVRDRLGERPVVAVDLPGHGGSTKAVGAGDLGALAAAVLAVLDALDLSRVHLVGHSMGGAVALRLARLHPERIVSVVTIASAGYGHAVDRGFVDGMLAGRRARDFRPPAEMLFADPALVTRDLLENLAKAKRVDGVQAALETIARATLASRETDHAAEGVAVPLLAIVGERDRVIPPPAAMPAGARAVRLPVGHMAHMEAPAEVARAIADFLDSQR